MISPDFHSPFIFPPGEDPFNAPFLAPRGIWATDSNIFVSDTAQNRVLIYETDANHGIDKKPPIILGGNKSGEVSAESLQYPSGILWDGSRLILADAWNHRVLIWYGLPSKDNTPADVVIGQADFSSGKINRTGEINTPKPDSLYWPYGVFSDGVSLWIADTGNRRIVFFEKIPEKNEAKADAVLGQKDFFSRDYDKNYFIWPYSIRIDHRGQMLVTDTSCFRVLYWKNWRDALQQPCDKIIGQKDLNSSSQNHGLFKASASGLNWCYDATFFQDGLLVADTGNSRILQWHQIPQENAQDADCLLGQTSFEASSENISLFHQKDTSFYWPFSLSLNSNYLWVCDTGNNRIIRYRIR